MADWKNFERYAFFVGSIIVAILLITVLVYWYRKSQQHSTIYIPTAPQIVSRPPTFMQQPFFGLVQTKKKHGQPTTVINTVDNQGNVVQQPTTVVVKGKKHKKHDDDSCSSDEQERMDINVYFWSLSECEHSKNFWKVWQNVQKRFKKYNNEEVALIFKNRQYDGRDRKEGAQVVINGQPIQAFPTVIACVDGQEKLNQYDLITNNAINEEELEQRLKNYIEIKKQQRIYNY